jgi:hypothetical protein
MMAMLAEVCAHLGDARRAAALYDLLLPFERRNVVTAQCVFDGPAARYLGILAATSRDWDAAERHFELGRTAAVRQHARPFIALVGIDEARMLAARDGPGDTARGLALLAEASEIASDLGMEAIIERIKQVQKELGEVKAGGVVDAPGRPEAARPVTAHMRREGDVWAFTFNGHAVHIRHSKGVQYLSVLLASPGVEIHSLELASPQGAGARGRAIPREELPGAGPGYAGAALDTEAKAAYRRRLEELREELEEAEAFNDPERTAAAREEMDFLARELSAAVGLGGRDRRGASNAERARVAVTKAVRATLKRIAEMNPELGQELVATIRTGTFCCYEPDRRQPVSWEVERE